jgi:putative ribosome biogenesis GTPase RsgA
MSTTFKVGDHVRWNSEPDQIGGNIIQAHKRDTCLQRVHTRR